MASKLTTLQEKLELLTEEYESKKEALVDSINTEKSRLMLLAQAPGVQPVGVRNGETYGSYFFKLDNFYFGVSTKHGVPIDVEEVSSEMVAQRLGVD